ncbi:ATP synthase F1 subcomplex delta subunit [Amycolatopsis lurida]|uniref:ATP synthase subunit delta n=1 Tax=Amycolatopsis lurida NRRL 2430 TaxID=1460371 RepID=A0A2P2FX34_AMYLU|nr:F0F1 ATP synthase subunit delta [Amycolatopsis lurida]KFU81286.1 ATP synthase subunit delta [Amycolatopsis lurida NRRL 2430]SEE15476.1 ATP synthase F1 subcomplex delta subunit [Amycolatopsis lurida]
MTLHAASREALDLAEKRLGEVLAAAGTDPATVGDELLSVVTLLDREIGLRRAVADGSASSEARIGLARGILAGKVSEPALQVLDSVAGSRWSSPRELTDGLEALGRSALLTSAEKSGNIDAVEDQLFRVSRIVAGEPELERALADLTAPAEAKRTLVRTLFADKVDVVTETLVEQVVLRAKGRGVGNALEELVRLAAERRERSVARVTSASALSGEQQARLSEKLNALYGRQLALHVEVDPSLGGGLVVRVGDEVIDGSTAGRIDALRRRLAG